MHLNSTLLFLSKDVFFFSRFSFLVDMFVLKVQRPQETDAMHILFSNIFLAQHLLIYCMSVEVQQFLIRCYKIVLFEKKMLESYISHRPTCFLNIRASAICWKPLGNNLNRATGQHWTKCFGHLVVRRGCDYIIKLIQIDIYVESVDCNLIYPNIVYPVKH